MHAGIGLFSQPKKKKKKRTEKGGEKEKGEGEGPAADLPYTCGLRRGKKRPERKS